MLVALTREPSSSLDAGERTFRAREPIDLEVVRFQHRAYRRALSECGAHVVTLPALDDLPDAVFVEDVAIVLDEVALLLPMGVESRRKEPRQVAREIARWREVARLPEGSRVEGGDVVRLGRTLYVGRTGRTDESGIEGLVAAVAPLGYRVIPVDVAGCLHLKSACTALDDGTILVNTAWVDASAFEAERAIQVPADEPGAANAVRVGGVVLLQAGCPRTVAQVAEAGFETRTVDVGELAKAEGSLTCLSLVFES
ncbi:MAG TPA: arginine deiminase family protein [Gemmatimonadota bacterium]|nr:arginine deiminase family protein [Gemmatimonadota bacterium]